MLAEASVRCSHLDSGPVMFACSLFIPVSRPDFDVAKLYRAAIVLQADVPALRPSPIALTIRCGKELAGLDVSLPDVAVDVILDDFFAVEPVLHVLALCH